MKILIIGYGSIGKRHEEVLSGFHDIHSIDIVTKQTLDDKTTFLSLEEVADLDAYDYFVIASETNKHYEQLKFLDSKVSQKLIFCEKPLFETTKELKIENNKVVVGYVLRFHPLLQQLREFLQDETILSVHINCGQYLPTWRPGCDYRVSYSAKKEEGGGVLLDLSHEIDYLQWLSGKIEELKSYQVKISDLDIDSDDLTTFIGKTETGAIVNVSVDYISKIIRRELLINTLENSYSLDFIANKLVKKGKSGSEEVFPFFNLERNYMFEKMHRSILDDEQIICSFEEGLSVMDTIALVQEQNR